MAITEDKTLVLAEVPKRTGQASSNVHLIIEENKEIQRYNFNTYVMDPIEKNSNAIGHPTTDDNGNTILPEGGILKDIEDLGESVAAINNTISNNETGLQKQINDLKSSTSELKAKKTIEGYQVQFIESSDNIDLLSKTATLNYTFSNINGLKLIDCIKNNENYCVNLHFDIAYELNNMNGVIYTNATINLNSSTRNNPETKLIALFLPLANAVIVLQTSVSGNNLTITVKDTKSIDSLKPNTSVSINYGELEVKYIQVIDNASGDSTDKEEQAPEAEEIIMTPLKLCFDARDLYVNGNNTEKNNVTKLMYGSKIKFDISDIGENCSNIHLKVKRNTTEFIYEAEELTYNANRLGNEITLKNVNTDTAPRIIYYDEIYNDFGIKTGTWFKYYTTINNNIVALDGSVSEILFDNYNYNGTNHQISYVQNLVLTDFNGQAITDENPHPLNEQEGRIDSFCIPFSQWKEFFAEHEKYEFILNCGVKDSTAIKRLTGYIMDNEDSQIINMYWEDTDGSKQTLLRAINYENDTATTGPNGRRTGIYLRGDMDSFSIKVKMKEESSSTKSASATDDGT